MNAHADEPTILVIEDDLPQQEMLSEMLTEAGYNVVTASLGGEGLMFIGVAQPDLVTLDLQLPDVNGECVLKLVRGYAETRDLPVVVITAAQALAAPLCTMADAVISKPFEQDVLLDTIESLLGSH